MARTVCSTCVAVSAPTLAMTSAAVSPRVVGDKDVEEEEEEEDEERRR